MIMKRFLSLILTLSLFILPSCSLSRKANSIIESIDTVEAQVRSLVSSQDLIKLDQEDMEFLLGINNSDYREGIVLCDSSGKRIDEIGIFLTDEKHSAELVQKLEAYVSTCKETKEEWLNSYNPDEIKKLKKGSVFQYGNWIGYTFLESDQDTAIRQMVQKI